MDKKKIIKIAVIGVLAAWLIYRVVTGATPLSFERDVLNAWLGAFITLSVLSFLYKDNPFYKIAEHLFVGISAAYWMVFSFWNYIVSNCLARLFPETIKKILPGISGETDYSYIIALILGIMLVMRLSKRLAWMSRWPIAYSVGFAAGFNFIGYMVSDFTSQVKASIVPVIVMQNGSVAWGQSFSALILITGVMAGLVYFFYSKEHKGVFGKISRYGIWILMITFGASFGYTVMGRIALLIGRSQFLLKDWLHVID